MVDLTLPRLATGDIAPIKHRAILRTAYGAGLRISEACSLQTSDLDSKRMLIHVHEGKRSKDRYEVELAPGSRKVTLDGKAARPLARYFGGFDVVVFTPEDLALPRASPGDRRRFLDRGVFNLPPDYLGIAQDYERVLKTRNLREALAVLADAKIAIGLSTALLHGDVVGVPIPHGGAVGRRGAVTYLRA